jgi:hypothetical protein
MDFYPDGFPAYARARVEAEKILSYRKLDKQLKIVSSSIAVETLVQLCILRIFLVFAKGLCVFAQENGWTVDRIGSEANEFLRRLTIEVQYDKGRDYMRMISHINGSLTQDAERQFRQSPKWKKYENLLLKVAATQQKEKALDTLASRPVPNMGRRKPLASRAGANSDPEVAKRRALVRSNLSALANEICEIFDRERVPFPRRWSDAGFSSWSKAYKHSNYRTRIDTLVSKDRRKS